MKKYFIPITGCIAFVPAQMTHAASKDKPNIIVILADDLGYGDLSCQGAATDIRTPHIDKLLNEGIRFTNFHANCPVSSPSRAALLTGRFPDLVGVPGVIRTDKENNWGYLSQEAVLLPQVLKSQGYHSAIVGKWHLGLQSPNIPRERGFDYFHGFLGDMMDDYYTHLRHNQNYMRENETLINPKGHATELFSDWAINYITERQGKQDPFFLYLAYNAPHVPLQPPVEWIDKVKKREPGINESRAKLVALIEHLDHHIGRLYAALEANGQLDNTLIIFTSDNGGQSSIGANNGPNRGGKGDMYEGGIHVAGGVYWKHRIQPAVNDNLVMLSDIFPTLCALTGVSVTHEIDGISVLPLLQGEKQATDDRTLFWSRREGGMRYGGQAYYAVRYKNYKLLYNAPWEPLQFFDLAQDSLEEQPVTHTDAIYKQLFNDLKEHVRVSGMVPWQSKESK
jgi:arylsulfatase A-like enzyme